MISKEFLIPEQNLPNLKSKIQKLLKKAEKTGLPVPEINLGISLTERNKNSKGQITIIKYRKVIISWKPIERSGWKILGKLSHLPDCTLLNSFTLEDLPQQYRNAGPNCDHCGALRRRLSTYVIQNESNDLKQVGDDCLEEYLKIESRNVINSLKILGNCIDLAKAHEALPTITSSPSMWTLEIYLAHVFDCIEENGWISRKQAKEMNISSTADLAYQKLCAIEQYRKPSDKSIEQAVKAIEWAESLPDDASDYYHNLKMIAASGAVEHRSLGYAASIAPSFNRELVNENPNGSEYVGAVGDRITSLLTVDKIIDIDTAFGEQFIHIFRDDGGNCFVWKTKDRLDEGKQYQIKGKIKEHKEFNGVKQTHLFYCKLLS